MACKKECKDTSRIYNENYLSPEKRSYVPLDKPEWDSISFLKNGKDTVTLYKISVDSITLFEPIEQYHAMSEPAYPNCNRVYQRYQNIKYTYRNDVTKDYMVVYNNKNNSFDINGRTRIFINVIVIFFNNNLIEYGDEIVLNLKGPNYLGDYTHLGKLYKNCFKVTYLGNTYIYNHKQMLIYFENLDKSTIYELLLL